MPTLMNKIITFALGAIIAIAPSFPAFGWGQTGHRVTGAIAQQFLSPLAQAALMELLPNSSLAEASTYADEMRTQESEFWQKTATPWHFVTIPMGNHYSEVGAPSEGDAITALKKFTETLQRPSASIEDKRLALRFVVHIIGDLHQPLHAGNGTDRGGNGLKVRFFWQDSNLHRVWDSQMIDQRKLSYTEWTQWLTRSITPKDIRDWANTDPLVWVKESTQIRDKIYPENANKMAYKYLDTNLPIATTRLKMAGIRMAMYLNEVFDQEK